MSLIEAGASGSRRKGITKDDKSTGDIQCTPHEWAQRRLLLCTSYAAGRCMAWHGMVGQGRRRRRARKTADGDAQSSWGIRGLGDGRARVTE